MMRLFVRIAEMRSVAGAGRSLGLSQPSSSRQLKQLEEVLGVDLVKRSTHTLTLTDAGKDFLPQAMEMLQRWEEAAEASSSNRDAHRGSIRVAAPVALGQTILAEIAASFLGKHPDVTIDWRLVDDPGDLVAGGYDLWIRAGPIQDDALIVHELGRSAHAVVAPSSQPPVAHPDELAGYDAVHLAHLTTRQIPLQTEDGRSAILRLKPTFTT
ncbi:LysR family transcriptional regulator, partial [Thioclava sp. BHET1]